MLGLTILDLRQTKHPLDYIPLQNADNRRPLMQYLSREFVYNYYSAHWVMSPSEGGTEDLVLLWRSTRQSLSLSGQCPVLTLLLSVRSSRSSCHVGFNGKCVGAHLLVSRFLKSVHMLRPVSKPLPLSWELGLDLDGLWELQYKALPLKTALLLAMSSAGYSVSIWRYGTCIA